MYWANKKAADSIRAYPTVLATPDEALQLKFVGPGIVTLLKRKLKARGLVDGSLEEDSSGSHPSHSRTPTIGNNDIGASSSSQSQTQPDVPATPRRKKVGPTRSEILASPRGQRLRRQARMSHAIPAPSPMEIDIEDPYASTDRVDFAQMEGDWQPLVLSAGSYLIYLVIDSREKGGRQLGNTITHELRRKGVDVEQRALEIGDVCWMAKRKHPVGDEYDEVALDAVLERKRLDDLCSSLVDKRFHEQKARPSACRITWPV